MRRSIRLAAAALAAVLPVVVATATDAPTRSAGAAVPPAAAPRTVLSARDRQTLSRLACADAAAPAALRVEAANRRDGPAADVECASYRHDEDLPWVRLSHCTRDRGSWRCETARDAMRMPLPGGRELRVAPGAVAPRDALALVRETLKLAIPPFQRHAQTVMHGYCDVIPAGGAPFEGAAHFRLACGGGTLVVTRDCWQRRCRYFITGSEPR